MPDGAQEEQLKKVEAIILSMTPEERQNPSIIGGSRRRRIAHGSGTHTSDITYIISYVISNDTGIPRIVFWYPCLDFAHQVGSDISGFCIYTATNTGEKGNGTCSHGKAVNVFCCLRVASIDIKPETQT